MYRAITKPVWQISGTTVKAVAPLVLLPALAYAIFRSLPAWELMWALALSIYAGLKWLTFASAAQAGHSSTARALAYLLLWPGMNAKAFLDSRVAAARPTWSEWGKAIFKLAAGLVIMFVMVPKMKNGNALLMGWIGMTGLILVIHFGVFHLLSLGFRLNGIQAEPIMNSPFLSSSLNDFWGRRWNLAFRDLAFSYVARPLARSIGIAWATIAVFVVSGLVHELVISFPVQSGWGGPTAYFTMQVCGLLLERSTLGHKLGLASGFRGRLFAALVVIGPVGFLFHEPFVRHAILPTLAALGVY